MKNSTVYYVKRISNDKIVFESGIESRARLNCDFDIEYVTTFKKNQNYDKIKIYTGIEDIQERQGLYFL